MVRIAITQAASDAIAGTLPLGAVASSKNFNAKGEFHLWLEPALIERLRSLRGAGESFSDVILRLIETEGSCGL